jgi:hypothetical protein
VIAFSEPGTHPGSVFGRKFIGEREQQALRKAHLVEKQIASMIEAGPPSMPLEPGMCSAVCNGDVEQCGLQFLPKW